MSDIQIDHKILLKNAQNENLEPYITTDSALNTESNLPVQNAPVANRFRDILYYDVVQSDSPFSLIDVNVSDLKQALREDEYFEFNGIEANGILINPNIIESNVVSITYLFKYVSAHSFYQPFLLTSTLDGLTTASPNSTDSSDNDPAATYLPRFTSPTAYYYPTKQNGIKMSYTQIDIPIRLNLGLNKLIGTSYYETLYEETGVVFCGLESSKTKRNTNRPTSMDSGFTCWRIGGDPTYRMLHPSGRAASISLKLSSLVLTIDDKSYRFADYLNSI